MKLRYEDLGPAMRAADYMEAHGIDGRPRVVEAYTPGQDIGECFHLVDTDGYRELVEEHGLERVLIHHEAGLDRQAITERLIGVGHG